MALRIEKMASEAVGVAHEDGKTEYIIVDQDMSYRMLVVLQYVGSFQVPFTDECVEYILYDKHRDFLNYMIKQVETVVEEIPHDTACLRIRTMIHCLNYPLPYLDSYVTNPPSVRSESN